MNRAAYIPQHELDHKADQLQLVDDLYRELNYAPPRLPALLTEFEVARLLKRSLTTLRCRRCIGKPMPAYSRIGRTVVYRPADVADYILASRKVATT